MQLDAFDVQCVCSSADTSGIYNLSRLFLLKAAHTGLLLRILRYLLQWQLHSCPFPSPNMQVSLFLAVMPVYFEKSNAAVFDLGSGAQLYLEQNVLVLDIHAHMDTYRYTNTLKHLDVYSAYKGENNSNS